MSGINGYAGELLDAAPDAMIVADSRGTIIYANQHTKELFGYLQSELIGQRIEMLIPERFRETHIGLRESYADNPRLRPMGEHRELYAQHRNGSEFRVEIRLSGLQTEDGLLISCTIRDVSGTLGDLAYAAHHDALTGLANRVLFESRLAQATALARRHNCAVAVLYLDLDHFKPINDTFGHSVGDRLLQSVARQLQGCVRSTDTVSRFGGDEFVVLLSEISRPADAGEIAGKILSTLGLPRAIDQHNLSITVSIGIGLYPEDTTDPQTLLRNADHAMFHAKRLGGNGYQFWSPSG